MKQQFKVYMFLSKELMQVAIDTFGLPVISKNVK